MRTRTQSSISPNRRAGMAMMLVIPAVALATVLAYAVLANTGMQQQISTNAQTIAQADSLAESGVNYAFYNLQNPTNAPTYPGSNWPGTGGPVSLGSMNGTVNITVTSLPNYVYQISSTASVAGITRTVGITVQVTPTFGTPNQAAGFNGPLSTGSAKVTVTGDLRTSGAVTLGSGSSVSGSVYATALTLAGGLDSLFVQLSGTSAPAVAPTTVTDYRTYTINGVTYSAQLLTTDPAANTTLGPTGTNPAGVYYAQNRTMNLKGVTINGTLLVKNGSVNVTAGTTNTITPSSGYPGLVVEKQIIIAGQNDNLTVNGLTWAATGINGSGSNAGSTITVNGSLLIPSATGINSFNGSLNLNYDAQKANVPTFSTQMMVPKNVKVLSWSQ